MSDLNCNKKGVNYLKWIEKDQSNKKSENIGVYKDYESYY